MSELDLTKLDEQMIEAGIADEDTVTRYTDGHASDSSESTITQLTDDGFKWPDLSNKKKFEPLPEAPVEALPAVIRNMCREVSRVGKVPVEVPMLASLSIVGFCVGSGFTSKYNDMWKVGANLYALFFQGPSERKSSVYKLLMEAVKKWIKGQSNDWRRKQTDNEILAGKIYALKKRIKGGNYTDTEYSDREELDKLEAKEPAPNPNFILGEGTGGAIADRMKGCGGKLFYASADAKDALEVMMGKYTDGKSDSGLMLQAYDGETYDSARRVEGKSVTIENPYLGINWMTQINQIENIAKKSEIFDNGLMSRFMVCVPEAMAGKRDSSGELVRKLTDETISTEVADQYSALVTGLLDECERLPSPYDVPVNSDAKEVLREFFDKHEGLLGEEYQDCQKVAVRVPTHAFRLALIFAMCRIDSSPAITRQDAENAIKVAMYFWRHMERALSMMSRRKMPSLVRRIINKLKKDDTKIIQTSPMLKNLSVKSEEMQEAIKWMLDNEYCREIEVVNALRPQGGRNPASDYEVNPTLL